MWSRVTDLCSSAAYCSGLDAMQVYSSLDVIDEKVSATVKTANDKDMFLGLLFPADENRLQVVTPRALHSLLQPPQPRPAYACGHAAPYALLLLIDCSDWRGHQLTVV